MAEPHMYEPLEGVHLVEELKEPPTGEPHLMEPDDLNVAIAFAIGAQEIRKYTEHPPYNIPFWIAKFWNGSHWNWRRVPRYTANLNELHTLESALFHSPNAPLQNLSETFGNFLTGLCHPNYFAGPRSRAIALLTTLKLSPRPITRLSLGADLTI